jgi:hypothetical protein
MGNQSNDVHQAALRDAHAQFMAAAPPMLMAA